MSAVGLAAVGRTGRDRTTVGGGVGLTAVPSPPLACRTERRATDGNATNVVPLSAMPPAVGAPVAVEFDSTTDAAVGGAADRLVARAGRAVRNGITGSRRAVGVAASAAAAASAAICRAGEADGTSAAVAAVRLTGGRCRGIRLAASLTGRAAVLRQVDAVRNAAVCFVASVAATDVAGIDFSVAADRVTRASSAAVAAVAARTVTGRCRTAATSATAVAAVTSGRRARGSGAAATAGRIAARRVADGRRATVTGAIAIGRSGTPRGVADRGRAAGRIADCGIASSGVTRGRRAADTAAGGITARVDRTAGAVTRGGVTRASSATDAGANRVAARRSATSATSAGRCVAAGAGA